LQTLTARVDALSAQVEHLQQALGRLTPGTGWSTSFMDMAVDMTMG